ncbi:MAG: sortase [Eubacteriales bacterium]
MFIKKLTNSRWFANLLIIVGLVLLLYFFWINYYGVIYHNAYNFIYEHYLYDKLDEDSEIFAVDDIPGIFTAGSSLLPNSDIPYLEEEIDPVTEHETQVPPTEGQTNEKPSEIQPTTEASKPKKIDMLSLPIIESRSGFRNYLMVIYIPRLGVNSWVTNGTDKKALKAGPGMYDMSDLPGEGDVNVLIAGHRDGYSAYFHNIDKMKAGDKIYITFNRKRYIYSTVKVEIIEKNDWSVTEKRGISTLTLTSCHPKGSNKQRIALFADLIEVKDLT